MIRDHLLALRRRRAPGLLHAGLVLSAALAVACSSSTTPPPEDPSSSALFGPNDLAPGTRVQVNRGGQWFPGAIVQPLGGDRFVVSYDGAGPEWNEAVGMDRIRTQGGGIGAVALARDYRAGEKVLVTSQSRVLLADVMQQIAAEGWRVHYDGYGPEAAENVGPDRLRRPYLGMSAHSVGEAIAVDVNGQTLPARVLALTGPDHWLVRFDGYAPTYDQEIGADRLRAPALPPPPPAAALAPPPAPPPVEPSPDKPAKGGKKAGKAEPAPVAPPVNVPLQVGDTVVVSQHGALFPALITALGTTAGHFRVRFDGSPAAGPGISEEEIAIDRVQRLNAPAKGVQLAPNQAVFVEWHGFYVPGKVLKEQDKGQYKVRFDGLGPDSDEIIPLKRLRAR